MKNQQPKDIECKKIAWTIKDFSKLNTEKLYSDVFTVGDSEWKISIFPKGNNVADSLSIYLGVADAASLPKGWSIYAEFSLAVVNHIPRKSPVKRDFKHQFCVKEHDWGSKTFMPLGILRNPNAGYISNDTCIIEVEWSVLKSEGIRRDLSQLIDFKDFGLVEKAFVPLLEEVCLWHPSLVECQKKRTRRFTEWAFTALGRVLHFLKTKKGKNMTEDACEQLRHLWEELETCRFDLTWLEPHVQSALGSKAYMENAEQVKKMKRGLVALEAEMKQLRENLVSLEIEMKKSKEKLADTEENVEKVRKDLAKAEEGFEERDMDTELGYGNGKP